jgi:hypothetical protein
VFFITNNYTAVLFNCQPKFWILFGKYWIITIIRRPEMADENKDKEVETVSGKPAEDWMARKWRPMMGWTYMLICFLDMAIFPVLWSLLQAILHQPVTQWNPLTLQGAGLFHISMGAVLGIAAYGRTQEKLGGASTATTTVTAPAPSFGAPAAPAPSFGAPVQTTVTQTFGGSNGSVAPGFGAVPPAPAQDPAYAQSPFGGPSKMRAPKLQDNPDA